MNLRPDVVQQRGVEIGLFLVSTVTLMQEILLTRIFSVVTWYHFAFLAISAAMLGLTLGAITVYLLPRAFTVEKTGRALSASAFALAVAILFGFAPQIILPLSAHAGALNPIGWAVLCLLISLPFYFNGICTTLILMRWSDRVGRLYAIDLIGGAAGCIFVMLVLNWIDAPSAVLFTGSLATLGAASFSLGFSHRGLATTSLVVGFLFLVSAIINAATFRAGEPLIAVTWSKGQPETDTLYERWNNFSRIRVYPAPTTPLGWGYSDQLPASHRVEQLGLNIDGSAFTALTRFTGDLHGLEHLKYDVTNFAHCLLHDADVAVIGAGGGRDILSALAFEQRSVLAVEVNNSIVELLSKVYVDFTGGLIHHPKVTLINDEARTYFSSTPRSFDLIQMSLIDTWAASAAGAFALTENTLYTTEAWTTFIDRLSPNGVLSVSRWYELETPDEMYRLVSLATAALSKRGVTVPRDHLAIVRSAATPIPGYDLRSRSVGTLLVSNSPFSEAQWNTIDSEANRLNFVVTLSKSSCADPNIADLTDPARRLIFVARAGSNLTAPTDDRPFFFQLIRPKSLLRPGAWKHSFNQIAASPVHLLGAFIAITIVLSGALIFGTLLWKGERSTILAVKPLAIYFGAIGLGFMFVEIAVLQRLNIFLGHPSYSLAVVLFTLLLSSGVGSLLSSAKLPWGVLNTMAGRLILLVIALCAYGFLLPYVTAAFSTSTTVWRILAAVISTFPIGIPMGMALPMGIARLGPQRRGAVAWLWGINGMASIFASAMGTAVSLLLGISWAYWVGTGFYVVALLVSRLPLRAAAQAGAPTTDYEVSLAA